MLGRGVAALAAADVVKGAGVSSGLVAAGLLVLGVVLWIDARARVRLLPHRAWDLRTVCGSGYFAMFAMTAATMGFAIYVPPILQQLRGFSPLWAGYTIGTESAAWTLAAMLVAGATGLWDSRWIRVGVVCLLASLVILALTMADGPFLWIVAGGSLMGAAFGFSYAFMSRRLLGRSRRKTGPSARPESRRYARRGPRPARRSPAWRPIWPGSRPA